MEDYGKRITTIIIACRILSNVGLRMFNANLHPDIVYRFTRFYRKEMESRKFCYAFTDKVMKPNLLKYHELFLILYLFFTRSSSRSNRS